MAGIPGVLAAKMSEPYDTPLQRTHWRLILKLIGRYASWYCKQQQNQNEGAPTTREQRVAQIVAERQAKSEEYDKYAQSSYRKMRAIQDEIERIANGAKRCVLQVKIMGMPATEDTYLAIEFDGDGFINPTKSAPPKGPIHNEIIYLRRCLRDLWSGLDRGEIDKGAAAKIPGDFNFRGITNKKQDIFGSWFPYFNETLPDQLRRMSLRFDEPFDQLEAYMRVEITSIVKALACDTRLDFTYPKHFFN